MELVYSEGLFVGYRGYEKNRIKPQYPFGYGLSYTKFRYSDIDVDPLVLKKNILRKDDDLVRVSFRVRNTGKLPGAEIAQLYVAPAKPPVERPLKELKGFQKVYLKPGESKKVTITLDRRSLAHYNVAKRTWDVAPGLYWILIGSSSQDIELRQATGELVPIVALGLGEFAGAGSKTPRRTGIDQPRRSWQGSHAGNARSNGQGRQRGRTTYCGDNCQGDRR